MKRAQIDPTLSGKFFLLYCCVAWLACYLLASHAMAGSEEGEVARGIEILTVDEAGKALDVDQLKWSYLTQHGINNYLSCKVKQCHIWHLSPDSLSEYAELGLKFDAKLAIPVKKDTQCHNLYSGSLILEPNTIKALFRRSAQGKEVSVVKVKLVVSFAFKACR